MNDALMSVVVGNLVMDAWRSTVPPDGVFRTEEQRLKLMEAEIPGLVTRASLLRAIAENVDERSRDRVLASGDVVRQMHGSHSGTMPVTPPHIRAMETNIAARERAQELGRARRVADETAQRVRDLEMRLAVSKSNTGQTDLSGLLAELTRAQGDAKAAQAALSQLEWR